MVGSELRLATLKYLLCRIKFYKELIRDHGYEKLGTCKNKERLDGLCNSIKGEVDQINELGGCGGLLIQDAVALHHQ